jgi:hypothetical protein
MIGSGSRNVCRIWDPSGLERRKFISEECRFSPNETRPLPSSQYSFSDFLLKSEYIRFRKSIIAEYSCFDWQYDHTKQGIFLSLPKPKHLATGENFTRPPPAAQQIHFPATGNGVRASGRDRRIFSRTHRHASGGLLGQGPGQR